MQEKETLQAEAVPYIVHESEVARLERIIKRLWILCIIIFLAFVGSNGAWIWYESQWETIETTNEISQEVDAGVGGNAAINGDVNIGEN